MTSTEFLLWVKGTGFTLAIAVFAAGIVLRLAEIWSLGRKPDLAEAKGNANTAGVRTIFNRFIPEKGMWDRSAFIIIAAWFFHVGLFVVIFFFVPHILLIDSIIGLQWPGLPTPIVDAFAVITMVGLLAMLFHRITQPVKKYLSTFEDYLVWAVTFLPLLTGYLAYHRLLFSPDMLLAMHILSVELLLVLLPFTKLSHSFTFLLARWYNGAISGFRGVQS